jgi:putative transposase
LVSEGGLSVQRACRAVNLSRAAYYQTAKGPATRDQPVIDALNAIVGKHGRWGFWKCHERLRLDGHHWNHKRTWRIYCAMRLNLPRRARKRLARPPQPLNAPAWPNEIWALGFMSDSLYQGRRFRTLNILDEGVRELLAIEIDTSLPAERVVRTLQQLAAWRGLPKAIRLDNGPELTAQRFTTWCAVMGIELRHIQPGKPNQNAFIERALIAPIVPRP